MDGQIYTSGYSGAFFTGNELELASWGVRFAFVFYKPRRDVTTSYCYFNWLGIMC